MSKTVAGILADCYENSRHVIIDYGDKETGQSWLDFSDMNVGRVSKSGGREPKLMIVPDGDIGGSILFPYDTIVRLWVKVAGHSRWRLAWEHPTFNPKYPVDQMEVRKQTVPVYNQRNTLSRVLWVNGLKGSKEYHAGWDSKEDANLWHQRYMAMYKNVAVGESRQIFFNTIDFMYDEVKRLMFSRQLYIEYSQEHECDALVIDGRLFKFEINLTSLEESDEEV